MKFWLILIKFQNSLSFLRKSDFWQQTIRLYFAFKTIDFTFRDFQDINYAWDRLLGTFLLLWVVQQQEDSLKTWKNSIFLKSAPNFMACLRGVIYHLPWLMIHNIKSTHVGYYHAKGFWDWCMYKENKWGLGCDSWVESPCMWIKPNTMVYCWIA